MSSKTRGKPSDGAAHRMRIEGLTRRFGGITAVDGFSCTIEAGEIVGLVGPNGAGKTTVLNIVSGFLRADEGSVYVNGHRTTELPASEIAGCGVSRTFQQVRVAKYMSVIENVMLTMRAQRGESFWRALFARHSWREEEGEAQRKALDILKVAGIDGSAQEAAGTLSYGQQKLLSISGCMAAEGDLLLLDEPVAGVQPKLVETIASLLRQGVDRGAAILLIEHNMEFVSRTCDRVIFIDAGKVVFEGLPSELKRSRKALDAYAG